MLTSTFRRLEALTDIAHAKNKTTETKHMDFDTTQTVGRFLLSVGALGIVLAPRSQVISAPMPTQPASLELTISSALSKQEQPPSDALTSYDSATFSVTYPQGWQVASQAEDSVEIVSSVDGVTMPIRTDVAVFREDPATAVPQRLDQILADANSLHRYSLVTVDAQSGFRVWYEPEAGQLAIASFVGYGNQQTAVLTSVYDAEAEAEALVTQVHDSFVNHLVAQAVSP